MSFKKIVRVLCAIIILSGAFVLSGMNVEAAGWSKSGDKWIYVNDDGSWRKNFWLYDNGWYYFDSNGYMVTGYQKIKNSNNEEHYFYFNTSDHGSWKTGRMMTGWQLINGNYTYFDSNGYQTSSTASLAGTIKGIDVSQYQKNIDWAAVKSQGISFAFVRVGHGSHNLDPYYKQNMSSANAVGIKTGVYFYSTAKSPSDAKSDAQWVIDQLQGYNVSYPVALDLEDNSQTSLGKDAITAIAKSFCDEIKSAGYTPMIYCNENWAKNYIDLSSLSGVYKWVARYNGTFNTSISRNIWQAGSTTFLNGISANSVDIDFSYTDFSNIVTPRTKHVSGYTKNTGKWVSGSGGWWYQNSDGSYPANKWFYDGGKWYYFDSSGYVKTGWYHGNAGWYYLGYYGMYEKQWMNDGGTWYYFLDSGLMATGWAKVNGKWYYFSGSGAMQTGWVQSPGSGNWYYLSDYGMLESCWVKDKGKWYYLSSSGTLTTGWKEIKGKYYYFYGSGELATNTSINGYYVNGNGEWVH